MSEKVFYKKDGSVLVMNPDIITVQIIKTPDNRYKVVFNNYELQCLKYTQLGVIFKELTELRYEIYGIDVSKIRE